MRLLFAISVASFCTVLWIALALARRIERERLARRRPAQRVVAAEIFEAGEYRTPRLVRPNQQVAFARNRQPAEQADVAQHPSAQAASVLSSPPDFIRLNLDSEAPARPIRHLWPTPLRAAQGPALSASPSEGRTSDFALQLVATERPQPIPFLETAATPLSVILPDRALRDFSGERKSVQSARSGTFRRVDLSNYNNEDMGDLTDPYTHIVRPSGVRRAVRNS